LGKKYSSTGPKKFNVLNKVIGTRSIIGAVVADPGTFQSTASTNTFPADSTTRNTPLPASITSNGMFPLNQAI